MAHTEGDVPPHLCEKQCRTEEEPGGTTSIQPSEVTNLAKTPSIPDTTATTTRNTGPTQEWMHEVDAANWQAVSPDEEHASTSTTQPSTGWTSPDTSTSPYSPSMRRNLFDHQDTAVETIKHSTNDGSISYHRTSSTRTQLTGTPSSASTPWHTRRGGALEPTQSS